MADITEYTDLVTSEHSDKVNFVSTLDAFVQPLVDGQNILADFPVNFDLDVAIGVMLDVDGLWIGLSRTLRSPITGLYFTFGDATLGFGAGVWKGPDSPSYGLVTLDDNTYRSLLKAKALANECDGALASINEVLQLILSTLAGSLAFVQDNKDMSITVGISGIIPPPLFQYLIWAEYIPVRPAAVGVRDVVMTSVSGAPIFGFGVDNAYIAGFGQGAWAQSISF